MRFRAIIFLGNLILSMMVMQSDAQPRSFSEAGEFLRAHPPVIGYDTERKACFDFLDREFKARDWDDEEIRDFYNSMLKHMSYELKAPHTGEARIFKLYNHGFILDLQEITIAFDPVHGMKNWDLVPDEVLDQIDIIFISHRHGDHFDAKLLNAAMDAGAELVIPAEMDVWPVIEMEAGDSRNLMGLQVTAHFGLHSVPVRVFEVTTRKGLKILHTGDNQDSYTLPLLEYLDILLLNSWVNESVGENSNVVGMYNCLQKLHPDLMIPGHCNELGHAPEQRYAYDSVFRVMEWDPASDILPMAWGEKFIYRPGSVIQLFHSGTPPLIDGRMDSCWANTTPVQLEKTGLESPRDWKDLSVSFRAMWDPSSLYLFVEVTDDQIHHDHPEISQVDGVELFFSGNEEEVVRMVFGHEREPVNAPGAVYAFMPTVSGYQLELSLPFQALPFDLRGDSLFGFDIRVSDNDSGTLDSYLHWWSEDLGQPADPLKLGMARLHPDKISSSFTVPFIPHPLKIDGIKDDAWSGKLMYSVNHCIIGREMLDSPKDAVARWMALWDREYLYLWMEIEDDSLINDHDQGAYQDDCVELWIDGDNSKGAQHDGINDRCFQFRFNEAAAPELSQAEGPPVDMENVKCASRVTERGWILEAAFPLADLGISPLDSTKFGLDLDYNDDDDSGERDAKLKYYGTVDEAWISPVKWGTGVLLGSGFTEDTTGTTGVKPSHSITEQLRCYPNPFMESLTVRFPRSMGPGLKLEILDLQGRVLLSRTPAQMEGAGEIFETDLSELVSGVYFVRCISAGQCLLEKIVKQAP